MNNCGIIEGYFGRPWNFRTRGTYPEFLRQHGYSFFIYAPKNDRICERSGIVRGVPNIPVRCRILPAGAPAAA